MISSVYMSGYVGEWETKKENIRFVEIQRVVPTDTGGKYLVDKVPVSIKYPGSPLINAKTGYMIVVKGRIEMIPDYGLVIVEELCEVYHACKS